MRWDGARGFDHLRGYIDECLALGVGGFLISGGPGDAVALLAADLHARSRLPLLLAADVERGAGQQFDGCIGLPPFLALGSRLLPDDIRRSARLTARELKLLGLNWALAPVCDLDVAPGSPIVGTRAAGADPTRVGEIVGEWIDACQADGVLACAKHFPGHGLAAEDSHSELPVVRARAGALRNEDLAPFRAALEAGVASAMTAHVAYAALDPSGAAATLSAPVLTDLLRGEMAFEGLIVSDALEMGGVLAAGAETEVAVRAVAAGCDLLLAPGSVGGVARALERAVQRDTLTAARARDALERRERWATWGRPSTARAATLDDAMWARRAADRAVHLLRGGFPRLGKAAEIVTVDDDVGGPWPVPSRAHFGRALSSLEVEAAEVAAPTAGTRVPVLVAAYADVVAGKGRSGFSEASCAAIARVLEAAHARRRVSLVVLFSHPRHAAQLPDAPNVACAWGGEAPMQAAAARVIARAAT